MRRYKLFVILVGVIGVVSIPLLVSSQTLQKCSIPAGCAQPSQERSTSQPSCGIEITCTDKPVQLGYASGVCFRATCPGVWALIHKRVDQASFRRRYITYRHYSFNGNWNLKDQGVIESTINPFRELFLVLPDDLIQFELRDPDCNAEVEVRNLGYIKRGSVDELRHWLAYNVFMERPALEPVGGQANVSQKPVFRRQPFWVDSKQLDEQDMVKDWEPGDPFL